MFEVRAYIGQYRKSFLSYEEALGHAKEKVAEEGQPYVVYELTMKYMATVSNKKTAR